MKWLPLECNPEVMNKFLKDIGVPENWIIVDVFGLSPDLLDMVPTPVASVILLYPLTEKSNQFNEKQDSELKASGQDLSKNIFFLKQYVSNACGTVALVHSVANNVEELNLKDGIFKEFITENISESKEKIGMLFEKNSFLASIHDKLAKEGQTAPIHPDTEMDKHFVSFVNVDGTLYELDGRKNFPINHGKTDQESFLTDCAKICQEFMDRDPTETNFAIVALANDI